MPSSNFEDSRRLFILEASAKVFARFGFRKTSMEEIAGASQISRQGLYLYFPSKEELFKAAVTFAVESSLNEAAQKLADDPLSLKNRMVAGLEALEGQYIGLMGSNYPELFEAAQHHAGEEFLADYEHRLLASLTACLKKSGLQARCKTHGITLTQLAETLHLVSRGLRPFCKTRHEFHCRLSASVQVILGPLTTSSATTSP